MIRDEVKEVKFMVTIYSKKLIYKYILRLKALLKHQLINYLKHSFFTKLIYKIIYLSNIIFKFLDLMITR